MFKDFFAKSPLLALPILSLAVFLTTFLCVVVFVVRRGRALEERGALALGREVGHE